MVAPGSEQEGRIEINTFVSSQAESLSSAGWEVVLGIVDDRTSVKGIRRNVDRLREEIARARPGLVHAQYGSVTAAVANRVRGSLPLVISFCGDDLLGTPSSGLGWRIRGKCARWVGLWAALNASAIVVKSSNLKDSLPKRFKEDVVTVLPNGVDINWFHPMNQGECRASLGWPKEGKIALFNASSKEDQYRKNPALARATLDSVARSMPGADLHMMSKASREEVRLMMNAADCLLVTSLHEGSPNVVKEAMSCNLPVVSVPCGDVMKRLETVFPGSVRSFDAHDLARAVVEVFRSGIRSNGRDQLIAQGLTTFHVAERLIHIYRQVQEKSRSTAVVSQETTCVE